MQPFARILAAVLVLAGGAVHLDLWRDGYKGIPYIGPLFLVNVMASVVVAAGLVLVRARLVLLAGAGLAVGSLSALVMSRTVGLLGFMEPGWTTDAMRTVAAEVGALVTLALVVVLGRDNSDPAVEPVYVRSRTSG